MIGDVLKRNLNKISTANENKTNSNALWKILRDIAKEEIIEAYPSKIDSNIIVPIYYLILKENLDYVPDFYKEKLKSNNQERFRVICRNIFSSNAFHPDGLANQEGIIAYKAINENKKGERIIFQGDLKYVNKK